MSIDLMSTIWKTCCYQDGCLVLLLAMADHGKDDGTEIYPGLDLLASKCRSSIRAVQDRLKRLRADGVVKVVDQDGSDLPEDVAPVGGRGVRLNTGSISKGCRNCMLCIGRKTPNASTVWPAPKGMGGAVQRVRPAAQQRVRLRGKRARPPA